MLGNTPFFGFLLIVNLSDISFAHNSKNSKSQSENGISNLDIKKWKKKYVTEVKKKKHEEISQKYLYIFFNPNSSTGDEIIKKK